MSVPVCPCPSKKVAATENFATQSCQIHFKGEKNIQSNAVVLGSTLEFHHLPRIGPKQLCALANLGCAREASTS